MRGLVGPHLFELGGRQVPRAAARPATRTGCRSRGWRATTARRCRWAALRCHTERATVRRAGLFAAPHEVGYGGRAALRPVGIGLSGRCPTAGPDSRRRRRSSPRPRVGTATGASGTGRRSATPIGGGAALGDAGRSTGRRTGVDVARLGPVHRDDHRDDRATARAGDGPSGPRTARRVGPCALGLRRGADPSRRTWGTPRRG